MLTIMVQVEVNLSIRRHKTVGLDFGRICRKAACSNSSTSTKGTTIGSFFAIFLEFDLLGSRGAGMRTVCHHKILIIFFVRNKQWACCFISFAYRSGKAIAPTKLILVEVNPSIHSHRTIGLDFGRTCREVLCCNSNT